MPEEENPRQSPENDVATGTLAIRNLFSDPSDDMPVTFTVTDDNGPVDLAAPGIGVSQTDGNEIYDPVDLAQGMFRLTHDAEATITGLPLDMKYDVAETVPDGFDIPNVHLDAGKQDDAADNGSDDPDTQPGNDGWEGTADKVDVALSTMRDSFAICFTNARTAIVPFDSEDYVGLTSSGNPGLRKYHDHTDLPASFRSYIAFPLDAILYYDMNTWATIYCANIDKASVDPQPAEDGNPINVFQTEFKRDMLTYILFNGQKVCDPGNDDACRLQLATQICVYIVAEDVYPGGSDHTKAGYDAVINHFPPDNATGALVESMMNGALKYAANPNPSLSGGKLACPSFMHPNRQDAVTASNPMNKRNRSYEVSLKDLNGIISTDWKTNIGSTVIGREPE
jgi:hypothetical protein